MTTPSTVTTTSTTTSELFETSSDLVIERFNTTTEWPSSSVTESTTIETISSVSDIAFQSLNTTVEWSNSNIGNNDTIGTSSTLSDLTTEWFNTTTNWLFNETTETEITSMSPIPGGRVEAYSQEASHDSLNDQPLSTVTSATTSATNSTIGPSLVYQLCSEIMAGHRDLNNMGWFDPSKPPPDPLQDEDGMTIPEMALVAAGAAVVLHQVDSAMRSLFEVACYHSDPRLVDLGIREDNRNTRAWGWVAHILHTTWIPLRFFHQGLREAAVERAIRDDDRELASTMFTWFRNSGHYAGHHYLPRRVRLVLIIYESK